MAKKKTESEDEQPKKLKKGKAKKGKGNRVELELTKLFMARFPGCAFSRVVGSGNRLRQTSLSDESKVFYAGDIVCPLNFRFLPECKGGYGTAALLPALRGPVKQLDDFLQQAETQASGIGKSPILCWKQDYIGWLAFIDGAAAKDLPSIVLGNVLWYRGWVGVDLETLLEKTSDQFWFDFDTEKDAHVTQTD